MNTTITVISFNIRGGDPSPITGWDARSRAVDRVLRNLRPDLIGFQEVLPQNINDLPDGLPLSVYGIHDVQFLEREETIAAAWNKLKFSLEERRTLLYRRSGSTSSVIDDAKYPRGAIWVVLTHKATDRRLHFITTHYDHIGLRARAESSRILIEHLKDVPLSEPIILTGDFNCGPYPLTTQAGWLRHAYRKPYVLLLNAGFRETYPEGREHDYSFHGFRGDDYGSRPDVYGTGKIDHILIRGDGIEVVSGEIIKPDKEEIYPSDHYPVLARLRITDP